WLFIFVLFAVPASAQHLSTATVSVALQADGVHAHYVLDHEVTRFAFAQADAVREEDMVVLTPGLTLGHDAISASKPFRRFDGLVKPFVRERDAKYPGFFRVGEGGVLYGRILRAEPSWRTTLTIDTAHGHTFRPTTIDLDGSIYIGPTAYIAAETHGDII